MIELLLKHGAKQRLRTKVEPSKSVSRKGDGDDGGGDGDGGKKMKESCQWIFPVMQGVYSC